jgi:hypothetical protein
VDLLPRERLALQRPRRPERRQVVAEAIIPVASTRPEKRRPGSSQDAPSSPRVDRQTKPDPRGEHQAGPRETEAELEDAPSCGIGERLEYAVHVLVFSKSLK